MAKHGYGVTSLVRFQEKTLNLMDWAFGSLQESLIHGLVYPILRAATNPIFLLFTAWPQTSQWYHTNVMAMGLTQQRRKSSALAMELHSLLHWAIDGDSDHRKLVSTVSHRLTTEKTHILCITDHSYHKGPVTQEAFHIIMIWHACRRTISLCLFTARPRGWVFMHGTGQVVTCPCGLS